MRLTWLLQKLAPCHPICIKLILHSYFDFYFRINLFMKYATSVAGFWKKTEADPEISLGLLSPLIFYLCLQSTYLCTYLHILLMTSGEKNILWQMILLLNRNRWQHDNKVKFRVKPLKFGETGFVIPRCFWNSKRRSRNADYLQWPS